jgi:hypothetical protein
VERSDTRGLKSAMMIAPRQGCEAFLAGHPEFLELRSSEVIEMIETDF